MENKEKKISDKNTIDLEKAIVMCDNWRTTYKTLFPFVGFNEIFRAFRIPIADIIELAGEIYPAPDAVRGYFAMTDPSDISTLKMLLVPIVVDANGNETDKVMDGLEVTPPRYYIYDFTQPCPMLCDKESPLYGVEQQPGEKETN